MFRPRPAWDGSEGPRWRIMIAPGVLQLSRSDLARRERTANRAADHHAHQIESRIAKSGADLPRLRAHLADQPGVYIGSARARISAWSARSRSRMVFRLASLDWMPLTSSGRLPAMITLTYPGEWLSVAPDRAAVDRHLRVFYRRFERAWGEPLTGAWKFEFQRRGAPHWCAYMVPPLGSAGDRRQVQHAADLLAWEAAGRQGRRPYFRPADGDGLAFHQWLSFTWAAVVDHKDPEQRRRHELAGTGVDYAEGMRSADPKRLAIYFSKHGQFRAKEYQNRPPKEWAGKSCGRFWGYRGLRPATAAVELAPGSYDTIARTLRRYSRARVITTGGKYPRTEPNSRLARAPRYRDGYRAEPSRRDVIGLAGAQLLDAHRPRRRTVRRRARYLHRGAGFVCVNDGPRLAAVLSRLLPHG